MNCKHQNRKCLNQYELIRKYICLDCNEVMMCSCDQDIGKRYLAHQLSHGREYGTSNDIEVTLSFQDKVCSECRGLPADNFPVAETYGRTSKIKRYYWREIEFTAFRKAIKKYGNVYDNLFDIPKLELDKLRSEALAEIKALHAKNPKYQFNDISEADVIKKYDVEVINIHAEHIRKDGVKKVYISHANGICSPEDFACKHFEELGYAVLKLESAPFHVLFGTFMWLLIQDPADPQSRYVAFGDRDSFEGKTEPKEIWTFLPDDFGKPSYGTRRKQEIEEHLRFLTEPGSDIRCIFEHWLPYSSDLRQYLWAHRQKDVQIARELTTLLTTSLIIKILKFLAEDYWARYLGWPDLLVCNDNEFFFVEVKSSADKLSADQKTWIKNNHDILHIPFKIYKIHKTRT